MQRQTLFYLSYFFGWKVDDASKSRKPAWPAYRIFASRIFQKLPYQHYDNKQNHIFSAILALSLAAISVALVSATAPPKCPPNEVEDEIILLPNPNDCTSYYACNRGTAFLMKCNSGLEFNAELKICDWPQSAHCQVTPEPSNVESNE